MLYKGANLFPGVIAHLMARVSVSTFQDSFSMTQFTNPLYASIERIARSKEERTEE